MIVSRLAAQIDTKCVPDTNKVLRTDTGEIAFGYHGRHWHDSKPSLELLVAKLLKSPTIYGEWRCCFEANHEDFNVEIVSFGYTNPDLVSDRPSVTLVFTRAERGAVESLIRELFSTPEVIASQFPFNSSRARFLGTLRFRRGWIRTRWFSNRAPLLGRR
jgi:hypothetical protein